MIQTLILFQVQPRKTHEFESTHRKMVELMSVQPGCVEIKAHRSISDLSEYMVYGTWKNKKAWEDAHHIPQFKGLFKSLPVVKHTLSLSSFFELVYASEGKCGPEHP